MNKTTLIILLYFTLVTLYGAAEVILQYRFSKTKIKNAGDKGLIFILVPFYMSVYLAPAEHILLNTRLFNGLIATGFIILSVGMIFRILSLLKLRKNFSVLVESGKENFLVTDGMYRYIRHPLYMASLMVAGSGCVAFSCIFTWIFLILTLAGILARIRQEEEFLISRFEGYREYMKKTYKLVPFIF